MPELPDVQVFKEYLDATSLHQTIDRVEIGRRDILGGVSPRSLQRRLKRQALESSRRHGKYLFAKSSGGGWLVLHFGMTGYLDYSTTENPPEHTRVLLRFENGARLAYTCMRMLGSVDWAEDPDVFVEKKGLGIDADSDELDIARFREVLSSKRGSIKSALMDQETIAGLGNVYTDEILFQARVHPKAIAADLDENMLKEIHRQLHRVLATSVRARAQPERMPKSFLVPRRGQDDARCPRCNASLDTAKVSGRTTYLCPRCQRR